MLKQLLALMVFGLLAELSTAQFDANCNGKQVIVHLFEWKWTDIARECEQFLGPAKYCGVQVSPPNEHVVLETSANNYPWWIRYQPVSYKLESRSGTEDEFVDMVRRCNNAGIRIYVDTVVNHMSSNNGIGSAGSEFDGRSLSFPGVPYSPDNFTPRELCPSADGNIDDWNNPSTVRNCYLSGLPDLYTGQEYVKSTLAAYFNRLIDFGVAGARIDTAKTIWPEDLVDIFARLKNLPAELGFAPGTRFYIYQDVSELERSATITVDEYYNSGMTTEYQWPFKIAQGIVDYAELAPLQLVVGNMARRDRAFIFVDNHDNQRGHGPSGAVATYKTPRVYKQAVAYTLAQDYGFVLMMSSYDFEDGNQGPPSDGYYTHNVTVNEDGSCGGGWICEHRWTVMKKMTLFRNHVAGTRMQNYHNDRSTVAFSRGAKGFFAMASNGQMDMTLQTGLQPGVYCNIVDNCATTLPVASDGTARVVINNFDEPFLAVCVGGAC